MKADGARMDLPKRMLVIGDFVAPTGFARVNQNVLDRLNPELWDIGVLAVNYYGDYTPQQRDFKLWPASAHGSDLQGLGRTADIVASWKPDVIVIHNDAWLVGQHLDQLRAHNLLSRQPVLGWCPPDSPNQHAGVRLNDLSLLLCPTQFGVRELQLGGYVGLADRLPYGVDTTIYRPLDQYESRCSIGFAGLPQFKDQPDKLRNAFIVGRADRNAPRKRYDLTLQAFKQLVDANPADDNLWLHCHCAVRDVGWDLAQLASYYGIGEKVIFTSEDLHPSSLPSESTLVSIYNSWSWHLSTSLGEGHGLVAHESAACGVPQQLPRHSAYGEWMAGGARFMDIAQTYVHVGGINTTGGEIDPVKAGWDLVEARHGGAPMRKVWGDKAFKVATQPCYQWDQIAAQFEEHCAQLILNHTQTQHTTEAA